MISLIEQIDFTQAIAQDPALQNYIHLAAEEYSLNFDYDRFRKPQRVCEIDRYMLVSGFPEKSKDISKLTDLKKKLFAGIKGEYQTGLLNQTFLTNNKKESLGVLLLEYDDFQSCSKAYKLFDKMEIQYKGMKLKFNSFLLRDIERIANLHEFPEVKHISPAELQSYKEDSLFRPQLLSVSGTDISLNWFDHLIKAYEPAIAEPVKRAVFEVVWSVQGSYALCLCKDEIELRGGPALSLIMNYCHEGVKKAILSNNEKYMISYNGTIKAPNFENYIIWDALTGTRLKAFRAFQGQEWGALTFEPQSKMVSYFYPKNKKLLIYELPSIQLQVSMVKQNLRRVEWINKGKDLFIVSYLFSSDIHIQHSTKITVSKMTKEQKTTNLTTFTPSGWDAGTLHEVLKLQKLGVVISAFSDRKKKTIIDLIFIHKDIAYSQSIRLNDRFVNISLSSDSMILAVTTVNHDTRQHKHPKYDTFFYRLQPDNKTRIIEIGSVTMKMSSRALLPSSPTYFCLVNTDEGCPNKGALDFGMFLPRDKGIEMIKTGVSMPYMDYAEFDPSGLFVLTASSSSNQFMIWSGAAELLFKDTASEKLHRICWRPNPKMLAPKEAAKVAAESDRFCSSYRVKDGLYLKEEEKKKNAQKYARRQHFLEYLKGKRTRWEELRMERDQIYGCKMQDPGNYHVLQLQQ